MKNSVEDRREVSKVAEHGSIDLGKRSSSDTVPGRHDAFALMSREVTAKKLFATTWKEKSIANG